MKAINVLKDSPEEIGPSEDGERDDWQKEIVHTGFVIRSTAIDAARLREQLKADPKLKVIFTRSSVDYIFLTGTRPAGCKGV